MIKGKTIRMWRRTTIALVAVVMVGFGVLAIKLFDLQILQGENLLRLATNQQLSDTKISPTRGTIYDCNMKPLAQTATVWNVILEPAYIVDNNVELYANGLASILGMDVAEVRDKINNNRNKQYVILKKKVENDVKEKLLQFETENKLKKGISLEQTYKRYYPYGSFAAAVLGFTGSDNQGLAGVENYYDSYLSGTQGRMISAKNALGTDMPYDYEQLVGAQNGDNLVLCIDEVIQHYLEKYLEEGIQAHAVKNRATAIMMDVNTGAVLGMAVKGDYDPNKYGEVADEGKRAEIAALPESQRQEATNEALQQQARNKAISDTYYPGSVFKMVTASMALQTGAYDENSSFFCSGSIQPVDGGQTIHCHLRSGHGAENFVQALCNSCNPAFATMGLKMGTETFYQYYQAFGFSEKTGIDLPGEASDIFFSQDGSMSTMDLAVASFGQNFSITPIQMITAACAVANGGYIVQPHVVDKIIDKDGGIVKSIGSSIKRQAISEETSRRATAILQQNAISGSGKSGYIAGYRICGKTGTSEKVADYYKNGGQMTYIASYCGFAPADNPKVALLVFFDTPTSGSYYGASVAGPAFKDIMEEVLPYLGVEKKYSDEEQEFVDIAAPNLIDKNINEAKSELSSKGLTAIVYGDGSTVVNQIPEASQKVPQKGIVALYTSKETLSSERVTVPDFKNKSISEVNAIAQNAGLNVRVSGYSDAVSRSRSQGIAEGTQVSPGTIVSVDFETSDAVM